MCCATTPRRRTRRSSTSRWRSAPAPSRTSSRRPADYPHAQHLTILLDMMTGLAHLHGLNIVHRDLKPANILLTSAHHCKLADMGLGKQLDLMRSSFDSVVSGSFGWQPAEVLAGEGRRLTKAVDVFSAGCVVYYAHERRPPPVRRQRGEGGEHREGAGGLRATCASTEWRRRTSSPPWSPTWPTSACRRPTACAPPAVLVGRDEAALPHRRQRPRRGRARVQRVPPHPRAPRRTHRRPRGLGGRAGPRASSTTWASSASTTSPPCATSSASSATSATTTATCPRTCSARWAACPAASSRTSRRASPPCSCGRIGSWRASAWSALATRAACARWRRSRRTRGGGGPCPAWPCALKDWDGLVLTTQFRAYYEHVSIKRLLQLQEEARMRYRVWEQRRGRLGQGRRQPQLRGRTLRPRTFGQGVGREGRQVGGGERAPRKGRSQGGARAAAARAPRPRPRR